MLSSVRRLFVGVDHGIWLDLGWYVVHGIKRLFCLSTSVQLYAVSAIDDPAQHGVGRDPGALRQVRRLTGEQVDLSAFVGLKDNVAGLLIMLGLPSFSQTSNMLRTDSSG